MRFDLVRLKGNRLIMFREKFQYCIASTSLVVTAVLFRISCLGYTKNKCGKELHVVHIVSNKELCPLSIHRQTVAIFHSQRRVEREFQKQPNITCLFVPKAIFKSNQTSLVCLFQKQSIVLFMI